MGMSAHLKHQIGSLFEVIDDEAGIQRVITPFEFPLSGDRIVVRVRPLGSEGRYSLDDNGDTVFYASMAGGDTRSAAVAQWKEELQRNSLVVFDDDQLSVIASNEELIAPCVFRIAEATQQLYALSTSCQRSHADEGNMRLVEVVAEQAQEYDLDSNGRTT
jgi:hypothetical protein